MTSGASVKTIKYVGRLYEKQVTGSGPAKHVHYIRAGETVAIYKQVDDANPATDTTRYLHRDHLGSIVAISDEAGALAERLAYDPHGKRRTATWEADSLNLVTGGATPRGFTGHEHLDDVGLIHMNGRVYDPVLGRFLSADPFVQFPKSTQGLNRYTYVNNNPLSATDPSGFFGFFKKIFRAVTKPFRKAAEAVVKVVGRALKNPIVRIAAAVAGAYFTAGLVTQAIVANAASAAAAAGASAQAVAAAAAAAAESIGTAILSGAAGGFVGGLIGSGGDLQSAFIGGLTGAAFGFVGGHSFFGNALSPQRVAAHGLIGGVSSKLRGGKFITGAITGAVSKLATPLSNAIAQGNALAGAIAQAVVGGATATLGGGKFANGAMTAAFGYLFNACSRNGCWVTAEERAYAEAGNWRKYYTVACSGGDAYACNAADIAHDRGFFGSLANRRLETFFNLNRIFDWQATKNSIRTALMRGYVDHLETGVGATRSNPQWPTRRGVYEFHTKVFADHQVPGAFGGPIADTFLGPFGIYDYCPNCR